jgi:hypothetical protein
MEAVGEDLHGPHISGCINKPPGCNFITALLSLRAPYRVSILQWHVSMLRVNYFMRKDATALQLTHSLTQHNNARVVVVKPK